MEGMCREEREREREREKEREREGNREMMSSTHVHVGREIEREGGRQL